MSDALLWTFNHAPSTPNSRRRRLISPSLVTAQDVAGNGIKLGMTLQEA
jgi:hypothetical protein